MNFFQDNAGSCARDLCECDRIFAQGYSYKRSLLLKNICNNF